MVKKLFKYEFSFYLRIWVPINIIFLGIALFGRIIQFFESDTVVYGIISVSSILIYVLAVFAVMGSALFLGIVRFYKNLFTGEGYLSFALPVTPTQHICVKALSAAAFQMLTCISVLLSLAILTAGDLMKEIFLAAKYLSEKIPTEIKPHLWLYLAEFVISLAVASIVSFLLYYTCISIGQLFKKNRILAAFGAYFAYTVLIQIIATVLSIFFMLSQQWIDYETIAMFMSSHTIGVIHAFFGMGLFSELAVGTVYFFVNKKIMTDKLNLE